MADISHGLSQLKMFWKQVQQWVAKETEASWVVKLDKRYETCALGPSTCWLLEGNIAEYHLYELFIQVEFSCSV